MVQPRSKHDYLKVAGLFQLALFAKGLTAFLYGSGEMFNADQGNDE